MKVRNAFSIIAAGALLVACGSADVEAPTPTQVAPSGTFAPEVERGLLTPEPHDDLEATAVRLLALLDWSLVGGASDADGFEFARGVVAEHRFYALCDHVAMHTELRPACDHGRRMLAGIGVPSEAYTAAQRSLAKYLRDGASASDLAADLDADPDISGFVALNDEMVETLREIVDLVRQGPSATPAIREIWLGDIFRAAANALDDGSGAAPPRLTGVGGGGCLGPFIILELGGGDVGRIADIDGRHAVMSCFAVEQALHGLLTILDAGVDRAQFERGRAQLLPALARLGIE